jgi:TolB-like protein
LAGRKNLARFFLTYDDTQGNKHHSGPHYVRATFVDMESPVSGFSNSMVLKSGTHLHFAQALKEIGRLYYSHQLDRALEITVAAKKELSNANLRLGSDDFNDQIAILDKYINILGRDLQIAETETRRIIQDREIAPQVEGRSLHEHCKNLFQEMTLTMETGSQGAIAVSGFTTKDGKTTDLITLLNEMAMLEIAKHRNLHVVERDKLDMVLDEQKLALSDLVDTTNAITVGKLLTVSHILTGTVLEMPGSVVIFGRIINVESGEIESAAQVIVPRNREVEALL